MRKDLLILITLLGLIGFNSCKDDDGFSTDSSCRLSYTTDSIKFEPLLTTITTSTRTLKVYNHSGSDLKIDEIDLESENENFQINVDGRTGSTFRNIEIKDGDSLFIFVRAQPKKAESAEEIQINDSIVIKYNGNKDKVVLSAVAQNAIVLKNYTINHDTTWTSEQPFLIYDSLKIAEGAKLTIKQGTEILFHNGASLTVDGTIDVRGTASAPVLLTGDRYDDLMPSIPFYRFADQWEGIHFGKTSTGNYIEGAYIYSTRYGIIVDSAAIDEDKYRLIIGNSDIRTASEGILTADNARIYAYNTLLANGGYRNVTINGGEVLFNQCTITSFSSLRTYKSLVMNSTEETPITSAIFNNSIIDGSRTDEISINASTDLNESVPHFYQFNNCIINYSAPVSDTVNYINCNYSYNIGFVDLYYIIDSYAYYDFRPRSNTKATCQIGNPEILTTYKECQIDLDGNIRDSIPVVGAYNISQKH